MFTIPLSFWFYLKLDSRRLKAGKPVRRVEMNLLVAWSLCDWRYTPTPITI